MLSGLRHAIQFPLMETKPRRTWLQFSIKSLLVITLMVASFFAGIALVIRQYEGLELKSKHDRARADRADEVLRSVIDEENDFKARHGISQIVRLKDLDLNEWGQWRPNPERKP